MGIDQYPAESLVVPAVVMDIRDKAVNADYAPHYTDVRTWEQQRAGARWQCGAAVHRLAICGSIDMRFSTPMLKDYIFRALAITPQFLLHERQIAGVGTDTHGVDSGQDETFSTNRLVLEHCAGKSDQLGATTAHRHHIGNRHPPLAGWLWLSCYRYCIGAMGWPIRKSSSYCENSSQQQSWFIKNKSTYPQKSW